MTDSAPTEPFAPALDLLRARDPARAAATFADLAGAHPSRAEEARLLELACLAQVGDWDTILERTAHLTGGLELQLTLALRGAALAIRGRMEEGLAAAKQARRLPRRPHLPDPSGLLLSPAWEIIGTMDLPSLKKHLAEHTDEPTDAEPLLRLLDPSGDSDHDSDHDHDHDADRKALDEQLLHATRVVIRRDKTERVIRAEQGIYLTIHDPASDRTTVRLFEGPVLGEILKDVVHDYLSRGFEVTDWTLVDSLQDLETTLLEAQSRGDHEAALRAARDLVIRAPDDARLAALGLGAAVAHGGYGAGVTLSQRSLALGEEPDWALRHHAAILRGAGYRSQCLGALLYLREYYDPGAMTADAWELLADCFVGPLHRPGVAEDLIGQGLRAHPDHQPLALLRARVRLDAGDVPAALEVLTPALAESVPPAEVFVLALQAHLEGGLEGTEGVAQRAAKLHPDDGLIKALALEVADRPGPSLKEYRGLLASAHGPAAKLALRLHAMRAALRVGAYEDGLGLAREAQTEIGEPDPRCLSVMYESLRALEPSEDREELAEMVARARRKAADATWPREATLRAILSAGIYLDPALLEGLWAELNPVASPEEDALRPQPPLLGEGLVCLATQTGFVTLFDEIGLASKLSDGAWDWYADSSVLTVERDAGRVAVGRTDSATVWVRVTTTPPAPADKGRFARQMTQPLTVVSGRVFVGPGEALRGGDSEPVAHTLGQELGGRSFYLAPGRYRVTVYQRTIHPWPRSDVRTEPCDVIFQIEKG